MIMTVTFNPAIDYVVHTEGFALGEVNRSSSEQMYFGGKGINVSVVLKELGVSSVATGFVAGFTGQAIEKGIRDMGIETDFVRLPSGNSRINVKIKSGQETELNGQGPDIDNKSLEMLFEKTDKLKDGDTLILAGSIPSSLPSDVYERILHRVHSRNIRTVVDASKDLLLKVLKYEPFLVKPNNIELGEMFGVKPETDDDIEKYARKLKDMGAKNVLVSMAGDGAMLIDENGHKHRCGVCKGKVINSVGAGDSMVAGFVAGVILQEDWDDAVQPDYEYALKLGTAAGGATAFSAGLATKSMIEKLM
ncbi:MAG: 1-phosphofructokinase [Ruminococcus sp.]|nr:1-phosphofructokinase [Ruminococcus sp.]